MMPGQGGARGRAAVTERKPGRGEGSAAKARHKVKADFEARYEELELLGEGGFGSVFAGFRISDELPMMNGEVNAVPLEVALTLKATGGPESTCSSAIISLLDWYDLDQELILVLERPVPCVDLSQYVRENGGSLQEHEAKVIMRQLVEAAMELHSKHVFHRDIKLENILVETGSDVPRVRVTDFSCGCFMRRGHYHLLSEWYMHKRYRARPTTVWQLGVVLYGMLDRHTSFDTLKFLHNKLSINSELSQPSVLKRWKLNWCDLWIDGSLCFYKTDSRRELEHRVSLKTGCVDVRSGLECGGVTPPESNPRENLIVVQLKDGSTVNLCANSEDESIAWKLTLLETRRNPVFTYDPYDDSYQAVPINGYHPGRVEWYSVEGIHQVIVQRDPFDGVAEQVALGLLAGMAAGAAMQSFLWMPIFFC
ncbi:serine/threonine-protein kinase PSK1-like protein [Lates japonicus]|uniref:non-specific serine/threonine protein kinase n=1 Tax=Lates japonicus TaxID=270547 RepID=A0AAD3QW08_LATJO|nr:serine/threonine-protein kinase PSK1-like protein [Lates japonicus]